MKIKALAMAAAALAMFTLPASAHHSSPCSTPKRRSPSKAP